MREVDVALTPAEIRPAEVAVVIDVLRATSTIIQALESGYTRVHCAESIEAARELRAPGRVLAGEKECVRVPDFELGNSPAEVGSGEPLGEELVLATTNGSPAIVAASRCSDSVLIGCLLNLSALVAAIPADAAVSLVCSGTNAEAALEDIYVAGRIVCELAGERSDAARVAACVARSFDGPLEPLRVSADGVVLRSTGQERDIAWSARESVIELVGEVSAVAEGAATVSVAAARVPEPAGA
jgi:2-phosphosulfolactate phosphatase